MSEKQVTCIKKHQLGEGTYGIVYKASLKYGDKEDNVAVKRNFNSKEIIGVGSIKELNYLSKLAGHQCVVGLKLIFDGDPFVGAPLSPIENHIGKKDMIEDDYQFILELTKFSLYQYLNYSLKKDSIDYYSYKSIICQIALGLEYCHSKNICHRDLKPENVLVNIERKGEYEVVYAKICDFGMSFRPNRYSISSPGTVSNYYRAPEIIAEHPDYSYPVDMWSLGCMLYELFFNEVFIKVTFKDKKELKHEDEILFKYIIQKIPEKLTNEDISGYICNEDLNGCKINKNIKRVNLKEKSLKRFSGTEFEKEIDNFVDLLEKLLKFYPSERYTATECLNHPFFDEFNKFKTKMRKKYPPEKTKYPQIKIIDCLERRLAANIVFETYNNKENIDWYSDKIMFHGMRLFDEYLAKEYREDNFVNSEVSEGVGRLHNDIEVELILYTCFYMIAKFFSCIIQLPDWDSFFPSRLTSPKYQYKFKEMEKIILDQICEYIIFKDTFYEILDDESEENDIYEMEENEKNLVVKNALVTYCSITSNFEGNLYKLYKIVMKN